MNGYSYPEMQKMQEDAKRRVMEMKKRAKLCAESFSGETEKSAPAALPDEPKAVRLPVEFDRTQSVHGKAREDKPFSREKEPAQNKTVFLSAPGNLFGNMSPDEVERMFILSLCLLLSNEHADDELLLSLMYMLT